jgi:hypothetical protein
MNWLKGAFTGTKDAGRWQTMGSGDVSTKLNQCHLIAVPVYLGEAAAFDRSLFDPDSLQQDHSSISHSQVKQILMHVDAIMLYISFFIHLSQSWGYTYIYTYIYIIIYIIIYNYMYNYIYNYMYNYIYNYIYTQLYIYIHHGQWLNYIMILGIVVNPVS